MAKKLSHEELLALGEKIFNAESEEFDALYNSSPEASKAFWLYLKKWREEDYPKEVAETLEAIENLKNTLQNTKVK